MQRGSTVLDTCIHYYPSILYLICPLFVCLPVQLAVCDHHGDIGALKSLNEGLLVDIKVADPFTVVLDGLSADGKGSPELVPRPTFITLQLYESV